MADSTQKPTGWRRLTSIVTGELSGFHPRLVALNTALRLLPRYNAPRARARLFSIAGFVIGEGTVFYGDVLINGGPGLFSNLRIGRNCLIQVGCVFDLQERVTIGDRVTIGHGAMILTSTHELDIREHRAGPLQRSPVRIEDGAWLGARSVILPGVTVGAGAVVDAGAVVNKSVVSNTRVGGIPAVQLEVLEPKAVSV